MRSLRVRVRDIMFQHDTLPERVFDGVLIVAIVLSVVVVTLDSVEPVHARYGGALWVAEWIFTILFTIEYLLRLWVSERPLTYARSFYGVVDLGAIAPSYLAIIFPPAASCWRCGRFASCARSAS